MGTTEDLNALAQQVGQVLKATAKVDSGVITASIKRTFNVTIMGVQATLPMAQSIAINLQPVDSTTVGGNFLNLAEGLLLSDEVNPVIDGLRKSNIAITALHNHWMWQNPPELWYLHWMSLMPPLDFANATAKALSGLKL